MCYMNGEGEKIVRVGKGDVMVAGEGGKDMGSVKVLVAKKARFASSKVELNEGGEYETCVEDEEKSGMQANSAACGA